MSLAPLFVLIWFLLAFALSISGWFQQFSSASVFGMGAVVSASGLMLLWVFSRFRGYARALDLKWLTRAQVLRFFGVLALIKTDQHILPAIFGLPTGIMDVVM